MSNIPNKNIYIQNENITVSKYYGGYNIYLGNYVTITKPQGNVIISNYSSVILDAEQLVYFEKGFEIQKGSALEVR